VKEKSIIILDALLAGQVIERNNCRYCFDSNYKLCMIAYNETKKEDVLLPVNLGIELQDFIKWCEKFTFEECYLIGCSKVLADIKREKRK